MTRSRRKATAMKGFRRETRAARLNFAAEVERALARFGMSQAELARRLKVSPPYVVKVLRGESNLSLLQMARIGMALGSIVHVRIFPPEFLAVAVDSRLAGIIGETAPNDSLPSVRR